MLEISGNAISLTKGDSAVFSVDISDIVQGQPYVMKDTDELVFTMRKRAQARSPVLVEKVLKGSTTFKLYPKDTADLSDGVYKYDIELRSGEDIYTVVQCEDIELLPEVTIP